MGALATITRDDGSTQVTYNGWPLYRFARDTAPGQINGQGITAFGGTWSAAMP
jgi:predicted lipoprotein with Yx(FWY)xxD motif